MNKIVPVNNCDIFLYGNGLIFIDRNISKQLVRDIKNEVEENNYIGCFPDDIEKMLSKRFESIKIQAGLAFIAFIDNKKRRKEE